jgi:hypothetical protein
VHAYDAATRAALAAGERVVLFSSPREGVMVPKNVMLPPDAVRLLPRAQPGANALPGSFLPVFWNARLFNQVGTLGLLCDPKHPALAAFPTEAHSDWQWADLIGHFSAAESFRVAGAPAAYCDEWSRIARDVSQRSKSILLDEAPPDYRPIVQVIDNQDRNARLGLVFETRVGPGRLLVCALDLNTDAEHRPAARQLRHSLLTYAAGQQFAPVTELPADLLERLLTAGPVTK